MKYALLIYDVASAWGGLSEAESKAVLGEYFAVGQTPGIVGGEQLHTVEMATTVRLKDGETLTTDGPFADTKEFLGGFYLLEADNIDTAIQLASRIPAARMGGSVEIRPVVDRSS